VPDVYGGFRGLHSFRQLRSLRYVRYVRCVNELAYCFWVQVRAVWCMPIIIIIIIVCTGCPTKRFNCLCVFVVAEACAGSAVPGPKRTASLIAYGLCIMHGRSLHRITDSA